MTEATVGGVEEEEPPTDLITERAQNRTGPQSRYNTLQAYRFNCFAYIAIIIG